MFLEMMLWPSEKLLNLPSFPLWLGVTILESTYSLLYLSSLHKGKPQALPSSQPFVLQHPILKHPQYSTGQPGFLEQNLDGMEARGSVRVLAFWVDVRTHVKWVWLVSECPDDTTGTYPAVRHTPCKSHYGHTVIQNFKYASNSLLQS